MTLRRDGTHTILLPLFAMAMAIAVLSVVPAGAAAHPTANPDVAREYYTPDVKWHDGVLGTVEEVEDVTNVLRTSIGAVP
jgi:hypothetical protein